MTAVAEMETDVRNWINEWNKNPKPFVWTKTADEILQPSPLTANASSTQDTNAPTGILSSAMTPPRWMSLPHQATSPAQGPPPATLRPLASELYIGPKLHSASQASTALQHYILCPFRLRCDALPSRSVMM
jgi:hypothetical protein